jgi:hypothetical protein
MFRNNTTKIRFIGLSIPAFTRSGHYLCTFCLKKTCPTRRDNRHMLQDAILQCETSTKFTREARPRRVGPKRRGRAHESRSRFVDMNDQWTFQCEIQKRHPLRDETSTDETTPKPDRPRLHLGRNRVLAYGSVTFPHSGVSRMSASVRLMIQGQSTRRVTSSVRQCHQLIKISEIKSEAYTQKPVYTRGGAYTHPLCIHTTARVNAPTRVYAPGPTSLHLRGQVE